MDIELRLLLQITRRLPKMKRIGALGNALSAFYNRKKRAPVILDILNFKMKLDPGECVDGGILFYPQLDDYKEIRFLNTHLSNGDIFLDIGANVGFYTLAASKKIGDSGRVISIEADPYNYNKLNVNISLSNAENITSYNLGVSDKNELLELGLNCEGNRGGNSFLSSQNFKNTIAVECKPLLSIIKDSNLTKRISITKIDIEGFEYRVLSQFFKDAEPKMYPQYIILEYNTAYITKAGGDVFELLKDYGYKLYIDCGINKIMKYSNDL